MPNGAHVIIKCLKKEGVTTIFGYPGAAVCPLYDALYADGGICHILVRHEQNAAHAANGYARASGGVGVCVATSGPGATNLITGIATAYTDSIPMVVITGQVRSDLLGRDVFQEADITGACEPFVKHSYIAGSASKLAQIIKEAFHIAKTGRPGPVLIDIPVDIQEEDTGGFEYPESVNIIGYKPNTHGHAVQIQKAATLIESAKRPVICIGGGVVSGGCKNLLRSFCESSGIPAVSTLMGIGALPRSLTGYLGMLGRFGSIGANQAIKNADVIIVCAARLGDRAVAKRDQFSANSRVIHIDIDPAEIGKNIKADVPIVGDIKNVLEKLFKELDGYKVPEKWKTQTKSWSLQPDSKSCSPENTVDPGRFLKFFSGAIKENALIVCDVGQHQIWCANNFNVENGSFLTTGGMGTMGYSLPAAIGAKLAKPKREVVAICGDGSFQMCLSELATLKENGIDIKIVLMQNNTLGMVREMQKNGYGARYIGTELKFNPDFSKLAEAYGIPAYAASQTDRAEELAENMLLNDGPAILILKVDEDTPSV